MEKQNVLRDKNGWIMANPFTRYIKRNAGILIAFILFCAVLSIATDSFLTLDNIFSVLRQVSINAILAFGMTFVLIVGGIDLSMGSVVAATGCLSVILITQGMSLVLSILIALCLGAAIGLINGFVISRTSIPPFIVTLAMMTAVRGIAYIMTNARSVVCTDEAFTSIGNGYLGPIPLPVVLVAALLIITSVFLSRTRFGRRMYPS